MKVAKSYQNYKFDETKAFEKNGKLYVHATTKCYRCINGIFVCRVENGQPVPHPNDNGVCYACGGEGVVRKDIRLYTDKEFEQMEKAKVKAAEKRAAELEKKMQAEFAANHAKWLDKNGFNENEETFIYFPNDSYSIKDKLKEAGFRFSSFLLWHAPQIPEGYEDKVIKMRLKECAEICAWGTANYFPGIRDKVENALKEARPHIDINSEWVGEIGERLKEIPVTLSFVRGFEGYYGFSQIVKFQSEEGNYFTWFTAVNLSSYEIGDKLLLTGTVKDHIEDKYMDNAHVTLLNRCKLKVA